MSRDEVMTDERLESLERRMDNVENAFPNKDPVSHLRYHEELIEQGRDRKRLIAAIQEKTISGLVWSLLVAIGFACWKYLVSIAVAVKGGG